MEDWKDKDVVTWGIMLVNIVYFLYLDLTGSSENVAFMLKHGAMFVPAVLDGESIADCCIYAFWNPAFGK